MLPHKCSEVLLASFLFLTVLTEFLYEVTSTFSVCNKCDLQDMEMHVMYRRSARLRSNITLLIFVTNVQIVSTYLE
jgi:hypothetical protein